MSLLKKLFLFWQEAAADVFEIYFYFFIYAFFGWCTEVVFAALTTGKFVNRGFLAGPVCPVYGFGMVAVVLALRPIADFTFTLFVCSCLLTSAIEFATGYLLERFFHEKWWDYSEEHFNIKGYVCLKFTILWGLACTFVMKIIHPSLAYLVSRIPQKVLLGLLIVFGLIMLADFIFTLSVILQMKQRLKLIEQVSGELKKLSDKIGTGLYDGVMIGEKGAEKVKKISNEGIDKIKNYTQEQQEKIEKLKEKLAELKQMPSAGSRRIKKAFPRLWKNFLEVKKTNKEHEE
ncbi:MAG: hypothetical protein HFE78_07825 [Clostridiales bacterium]|nr:hypothetical protein [Clostridiales bacterium]